MPLPYNAQTLRQQDNDRFLLSLMVPAAHREALWTLFAFHHEIAKTRDVVSDTTLGLIRLQWWREAIAEIYDGKPPRSHIVMKPLADVMKIYDLPRELFNSLIYAREFDLEGVPPANKQGLINYCDFTNTPLNELALRILNDKTDEATIIQQISINYALVGLLRALPYMLARGRVMIPQDCGFKPDRNVRETLPDIVENLLSLADFTVTPQSKYLKRMNKMTRLYAEQIKRAEYDVFSPRLRIPPKFLALRVLFS